MKGCQCPDYILSISAKIQFLLCYLCANLVQPDQKTLEIIINHMRPFIVTFLLNFVSSRRIALMILIRTDQDDSSSNELLAQLLCQIKITEKYFESVAQKIFKDGIDWRRIISFLYMSYKLILKAVDEKGSIDLIMSWLKRYFCQYLVGWISSNGGWVRNVFFLQYPCYYCHYHFI